MYYYAYWILVGWLVRTNKRANFQPNPIFRSASSSTSIENNKQTVSSCWSFTWPGLSYLCTRILSQLLALLYKPISLTNPPLEASCYTISKCIACFLVKALNYNKFNRRHSRVLEIGSCCGRRRRRNLWTSDAQKYLLNQTCRGHKQGKTGK